MDEWTDGLTDLRTKERTNEWLDGRTDQLLKDSNKQINKLGWKG